MTKIIKCKVCKKKLTQDEVDFFKQTRNKICWDCEAQELEEQGKELDNLYEELSKDV